MPSDLKGYLTDLHWKEGYRPGPNGEEVRWLAALHLLASEGTFVAQVNMMTGEMDKFRIPTLVPSTKEDGSCVHYKDSKCGVHNDSPTGCKMFNACAVGKKAEKQDEMATEYQQELMGVWVRCQAVEEGMNEETRRGHGLEDPTEEEQLYCKTWHYLWQIGKRKENAVELMTKYQEGVI
jgi:Fe-S-cluster containining protein